LQNPSSENFQSNFCCYLAYQDVLLGNVNMTLSGHDHSYQRGYINGTYSLVLGGGGGKFTSLHPRHWKGLQFAYGSTHHFLLAEVKQHLAKKEGSKEKPCEKITFKVISEPKGKVIDSL